jgi:alpha-tubulin suppressor-like RCC1 family protein
MSTPLVTINQLSAANNLVGTELTPVYQNADTFRTDINSIVNFASSVITPPLSAATQILSSNVFTQIGLRLPLAGGTMTGYITANAGPTAPLHVATKQYVDNADALRVPLSGGTMTGFLSVATPIRSVEVANKQYVDSLFAISTAAAVELIRGAKASKFLYGFSSEGGAVSQGTRGKFFYLDGLNRVRMSGRDGNYITTGNFNPLFGGGGTGQAYSTAHNAFLNAVVPIQMETNEYAVSAVGIGAASFLMTNKGNVYSTGQNSMTLPDNNTVTNGILGINDTATPYFETWQKISNSAFGGASAVQIAATEVVAGFTRPRGQVAVIDSNGKGYAWGSNNFNQILDATTNIVAYPAVLSGGSLGQNTLKQVLPANCAMFVIDSNNRVHVRGNGIAATQNGTAGYQPGFANGASYAPLMAINSTSTGAVTFSACSFTPPGATVTLGMQADRLYISGAVGNGASGSYTSSDAERKFVVTNYSYATVYALTAGRIWATGYNYYGQCAQLTQNNILSTFRPVLSATNAPLQGNFKAIYPSWSGGVLAVEDNGRTWGWGWRKNIGLPGTGTFTASATIIPSLSNYNVKKIINATANINASNPAAVAITTNGKVLATGSNKFGLNGQGTITPTGAGSNTWLEVKLPTGVSAIDVNYSAFLYSTSDDGDDDLTVTNAPSMYLLTTDSPEKTLYDIYAFGTNAGFSLGINQMTNAAVGNNTVSLPIKVSINL